MRNASFTNWGEGGAVSLVLVGGMGGGGGGGGLCYKQTMLIDWSKIRMHG